MPSETDNGDAISMFSDLVRRIAAEDRSLSRREALRRAAKRSPSLHRKFILATNPGNQRQAAELLDWRRQADTRRQPPR
jgi:hypothetical protein